MSETSSVNPNFSLARAFDLTGRVFVITGGAGLLGTEHALAIAGAGGTAILADIRPEEARSRAQRATATAGREVLSLELDVTSADSCRSALNTVLQRCGRVDGLINNAARNPKVEGAGLSKTRLEEFSLEVWNQDLAVGLTGAFLMSQVFGAEMARQGRGVIVNVASDLGLIAPDQRIYRKPGLPPEEQPVKPVTYSVVKGGLVMFTKYLATYFAEQGVRVNTLSPGGVYADQPDDFVARLSALIPLGRMAKREEYRAALVFLCSDASSYMTGSNLVIDGGRTCW